LNLQDNSTIVNFILKVNKAKFIASQNNFLNHLMLINVRQKCKFLYSIFNFKMHISKVDACLSQW